MTTTKTATLFLGTLPFKHYTLTVVADTEAAAKAALRAEYERAGKPYADGDDPFPPFDQHYAYVGGHVAPITTGKVEWF